MAEYLPAKILRILPLAVTGLFCALVSDARAQTTVNYLLQDGNFPTQFNNGGDFFNQGSTELGMWANAGAKQTVAWKNFNVDGQNSTTLRNLQIGDVFTITVSATRAFGQIGFSLNAGGTQGSSYANNISGSRMFINTDNFGAWYVGGLSGGPSANVSLGYTPIQDVYKDYRFTVRITSQTTADIYLTVDGVDYRAFNRTLGGSAGANISAFSIYGSDMWDGTSNDDAFWKQTTSVQNSGRVELGYFATSGTTFTPGLITDGLAADSTSTGSANAVFIGGDAGSQVNLSQANTYTGSTTVNANARLEVQNAAALGGTANGTTVTATGALSLFQATGGITVANESLTLNGVGVSGANGALRNTGGNNVWNGAISLASNSRINSDTTGSSGSLTIGGNVSAGANVLFLGSMGGTNGNTGGNITINGAISGAGASQDTTITSIYKDGTGVLTLGGANTYTGDTRIAQGNLTVSGSGALGSGSDVYIASGGSLSVNSSVTVASVQEWANANSGTIAIGSGATLTINGADRGNMFQNSISGAGGLTMAGSGNTTLGLFGTQSYTGATTVSGGKLSTGVALASSGVTVSGGTFETTAANILGDTAAVTVNSGTYSVGGNDAIGALSGTGGTISLSNNRLTTTVASGSSSSYTGGTITGTGGGITKAGSGTFTLGGTHTYTGSTTVSQGELRMMGVLSSSSLLNVNAGATLSGTGTIGGAATISGIHSPGTSPGIQTFSSGLTYNAGSTNVWELTSNTSSPAARGTSYDGVNLGTGANLTFAGTTKMSLVFNSAGSSVNWTDTFWSSDKSWLVYDLNGGSISGTNNFSVDSINWADSQGNLFTQSRPEASFSISVSGQDLNLIYTIPEPSTYALLALSGIALGFHAYRRRRRPML